MKKSRAIRRNMLRIIPEWMRCFSTIKAKIKKLKTYIKAESKKLKAEITKKTNAQLSALKSGVRAHSIEWGAAALAAVLIVAPCPVSPSPDFQLSAFSSQLCLAAPEGGVVVGGNAQISAAGNVTTISQTSDRVAIDWSSFDISKNETVTFAQPGVNSAALNRVIGNTASQLLGNLNANGHIYIVNPNGVNIGSSATMNVGGLVVTTANITPAIFMTAPQLSADIVIAGSIQLTSNNAGIVVSGKITAADNGKIILLGDKVDGTLAVNNAILTAPGGFVETSAAKVTGLDRVRVATSGGNWLIDPTDFNIGGTSSDISGAVLGNNLNSNNITILSSQGKVGSNGNVNVNDAVSWTADTNLSLSAFNNVNINASISNATSKKANVSLRADNTGIGYTSASPSSGGSVVFNGTAANVNLVLAGTTNVDVYTNPASYGSSDPTGRTSAAKRSVYYLVNQLGNATDNASAHSLAGISNNSSLWGKSYALGRNIDAAATSGWNVKNGVTNGFIPIGNVTTAFSGNFDGLGNTLSNLFIHQEGTYSTLNLGLIGKSAKGSAGVISNLTLNNANISGASNQRVNIGGILGFGDYEILRNVAVVNSNISAAVAAAPGVYGTVNIGALAGSGQFDGGLVRNTNITATEDTGVIFAGGAVGSMQVPGNVNNITVDSLKLNVTGGNNNIFAGGIIGTVGGVSNTNNDTLINSTLNVVNVGARGSKLYLGGIFGDTNDATGSISNSSMKNLAVSNSNITGNSEQGFCAIGGVGGELEGKHLNIDTASVTNSKISSTSNTGTLHVGGVIGDSTTFDTHVSNITFAGGKVSVTNNNPVADEDADDIAVGGLYGWAAWGDSINNGTVTDSEISASTKAKRISVGGGFGEAEAQSVKGITITNLNVHGYSVDGAVNVGGVVGYNSGVFSNGVITRNTVSAYSVNMTARAGGVAGANAATLYDFYIRNLDVQASSDTSWGIYAGGVVGEHAFQMENIDIADCNITANNIGYGENSMAFAYVGGIAGYVNMAPYRFAGGVLRHITATNMNISGSSKYGSVEIGGMVGENNDNIYNYSLSNITLNATCPDGILMIGGIAGYNAAGINAGNNSVSRWSGENLIKYGQVSGVNINVSSNSGDIYAGGAVGYSAPDLWANMMFAQLPENIWVGGAYYLSQTTLDGVNISAKSTTGNVYVGGAAGEDFARADYLTISNTKLNADSTNGMVYVGGVAGHLGGEGENNQLINVTANAHSANAGVYAGGVAGASDSFLRNNTVNSLNISAKNDNNATVYIGGLTGSGAQPFDERTFASGVVTITNPDGSKTVYPATPARPVDGSNNNSVNNSTILASGKGAVYGGGLEGYSKPYAEWSLRFVNNSPFNNDSVNNNSITLTGGANVYGGGLFGYLELVENNYDGAFADNSQFEWGINNALVANNKLVVTSNSGNSYAGGVAAVNGSIIYNRNDGARVVSNNTINAIANSGSAYAGDLQAIGLSGVCASTGTVKSNSITAQLTNGTIGITQSTDGSGIFSLTGSNAAVKQKPVFGYASKSATTQTLQTGADSSVILGAGNITGGGLSVNSYGDIVQSGTVKVIGGLNALTTAGNISLMNGTNDFDNITFTASAGTASIADSNAVNITGANLAKGAINVKAGGALGIADNATIATKAAGNAVVLSTGGDFTTSIKNTAITTGTGGRFLVYMVSPSNNKATVLTALTDSGNYGDAYVANVGKNVFMYQNAATGKLVVSGSANVADGSTIDIVSNGTMLGSATVSGGKYTINLSVATLNAPFMVFIDNNASVKGGSLYSSYASGGSYDLSSALLAVNNLSSTSALRGVLGSYSNSYLPYSYSGNNINVAAGVGLTVNGNSFAVDGNITTTNANQTYNTALNIFSNLAFNANQANINFNGAVNAATQNVALNGKMISAVNAANDWSTVLLTSADTANLVDTNGIVLGAGSINNLNVAAVTISQSGAIKATNLTAKANTITLDNANNDWGTVNLTASGTVTVADSNALIIGAVSAANLNVKATAITQSAAAKISSVANINGTDITLTNSGNDWTTLAVSGNKVSVFDSNAVNLGAVTAASLNVNASAITQSAAAKVAGTASLNASDINLANAANDWSTVTLSAANNATLSDGNGIILGAVTAGNLTVSATSITQNAAAKVGGTASFSAADVTLTNAANDFATVAFNAANSATLTDVNAVNLGAVTAANLTVNATAITQTAAAKVSGNAVFSANDIALTNAANDFNAITLTAVNGAAVSDANAVTLGVTKAANLTVAAGSIGQSAAAVVSGQTTLNSTNGDITMTNTANDFITVTMNASGNATINDVNALTIQGANNAGNVYTAAAAGNLNIATGSTINAGASGNAVVLSSGSDFLTAIANSSITTPNGRFLVYMLNQVNNKAPNLTAKTDSATYPSSYSGNAGSNVFLYKNAATGNLVVAGTANVADGSQIDVICGGVMLGSATVSGGKYTVNLNVPTLTGAFMVFIDNNAIKGGSVFGSYTSGGSYGLSGSQLSTSNINGMSDMRGVLGNYSNTYLPYSYSGNNISVASGLGFTVNGGTFAVDGNILTTNGNQTYNAALGLLTAATFNAQTAGNLSFSGAINANNNAITLNGKALTATNTANDFNQVNILSATTVSLTDANAITVAGARLTSLNVKALGDVTLGIGTNGINTTGNLTAVGANIATSSDSANYSIGGSASYTATAINGNIVITAPNHSVDGTYDNNFSGSGSHNLYMSNSRGFGSSPLFALATLSGSLNNLGYKARLGEITLGGANLTNIKGNLSVDSQGALNESAAITVAGDALLKNAYSTYNLSGYDNNFAGTTTFVLGTFSPEIAFKNISSAATAKLVIPDDVNKLTLIMPNQNLVFGAHQISSYADITANTITLNGRFAVYRQTFTAKTLAAGDNFIINSTGQLVSSLVPYPGSYYAPLANKAIVIDCGVNGSFRNYAGVKGINFTYLNAISGITQRFIIAAGAQTDLTFGGLTGTTIYSANSGMINSYIAKADGVNYFLVGVAAKS